MKTDLSDKELVFPPDSNPYGVSYAEWTARWWQWILSLQIESHPAIDQTGENCKLNQNGPVWFLAGTVGGVAHRSCSISSGLALLLPVLNHGGTLADEPTFKSDDDLQLHARREMDVISELEVNIDGMNINGLEEYRVQTPVFDVVLPKNNLFGGIPGPTKGVADGYWLFIKPFALGKHKIHCFGSCRAGKVIIGIDWDITIT